jgi:hypothetical protein
MRSNLRVPSPRLHKSSALGVTTLNGRDYYCGRFDTDPASPFQQRYRALISEFITTSGVARARPADDPGTLIGELIVGFLARFDAWHPGSGERLALRVTFKVPGRLYGTTPAADFAAAQLEAIPAEFIKLNWCRKHDQRANPGDPSTVPLGREIPRVAQAASRSAGGLRQPSSRRTGAGLCEGAAG